MPRANGNTHPPRDRIEDTGEHTGRSQASFRLRTQRFFLTYPLCPIEPQVALDFLRDLNLGVLLEYVVAREKHQSGEFHLHCYLRYEQSVEVTDARKFDCQGFHPNIQSCRSARAVRRYVCKGGEYLSSLDPGSLRPSWGELIQLPTREEFMAAVRQYYPRDYVLYGPRINSFAESFWPPPRTPSPARGVARVPLCLADYVAFNIFAPQSSIARPRSLFLFGDSRLGKTVWARSIGVHSYFLGDFNVDNVKASAAYAVFDDFDYSHRSWQWWKNFVGCQKDIVVTDKYRPKTTLRWGIPSIFLSNDDVPISWPQSYCDANLVIIKVTRRLY